MYHWSRFAGSGGQTIRKNQRREALRRVNTMKALVKFAPGPGNLEIRDIPEPTPGPGQVKIEIREAGICGSDLHIYKSDIAIPVNPPEIGRAHV